MQDPISMPAKAFISGLAFLCIRMDVCLCLRWSSIEEYDDILATISAKSDVLVLSIAVPGQKAHVNVAGGYWDTSFLRCYGDQLGAAEEYWDPVKVQDIQSYYHNLRCYKAVADAFKVLGRIRAFIWNNGARVQYVPID